MKFIVTILLLMCIVSAALGALRISRVADPNNPHNCLVDGISLKPGFYDNPGSTKCTRVECSKGGRATISSCGAIPESTNCINLGYKYISSPYPRCCEVNRKCTTY